LIDSAFTMMNHQLLGMLATGQPPEKLGSGAQGIVYEIEDLNENCKK
jgi:hypothetical protein